jgi:hypothetical protein
VGEYFVFPALTTTGECEVMVFEGHHPGRASGEEQVDPRDLPAVGG